MKLIGITGGVGAGKSEIISYLESNYNSRIEYADKVAHMLEEPGQVCFDKLVKLLGKEILKDGKIDNVEILEHAETEGLGGVALPQYAAQTVEKQSLDIDVVSGVTVSMNGYKEAVNDALSKAVN